MDCNSWLNTGAVICEINYYSLDCMSCTGKPNSSWVGKIYMGGDFSQDRLLIDSEFMVHHIQFQNVQRLEICMGKQACIICKSFRKEINHTCIDKQFQYCIRIWHFVYKFNEIRIVNCIDKMAANIHT